MRFRTATLGVLVVSPLVLAGCSSGSTPATTHSPTATASAATLPPGSASFDGDFNGVLTMNLCTKGHVGSVQASIDGDDSSGYLGSVSRTELNFKGPKGGIFSTKPGTRIKIHGKTFDTDGLVLTDTLVTEKSVTVHGDLACP